MPLFPERDGSFDFLRLQKHPLPAHLYEWHFERHQSLELLAAEWFITQGELPIEGNECIPAQNTLADDIGFGFHLGADTETCAGLVPPRRNEDAKTAAFQQRTYLAQKGESLIGREPAGLRAGGV
ncbi:MAG: hypothetical protein BWY63_03527 [Chloroflexi bacterium ADurb.Bin360]|nr:MAG: hypothetical protein BWY63_03527 [Chloroflexi bacterium ADurb.Bin360]